MTLYEFLSKFVGEYVKIIHTIPNKPKELIFTGFISDFLSEYSSKDKLSKSRYFNAFISNNKKLIVHFQYNREVKI